MILKSNYTKLNEILVVCNLRSFPLRFFTTQRERVPLVKKVSSNRTEWETLRNEEHEDGSYYYNSQSYKNLAHSGFGKSPSSKSKLGFKYLGKLQMVNESTSEEKLGTLFAEVSKYIDEFTPYELIDMGYFMTRINRPLCSQVVEPIFHRFFSLPERYSCLNGIYFHRLLRTMFVFQDVTYRVWVYEIAKMVASKHEHLLMRDVQLIIDDLSLFYDAAAQGALVQLEESVLRRINELEIYRLPMLIHALGRCGYNSRNVAKVVHSVYTTHRGHTDYYSSHLIGLLLKGYVSFHYNPGREFLTDIWANIESRLHKVEFKYLSWISESLMKLRFFDNTPKLMDELIEKHKILSHLEFTDFISDCWSIQTHILSLEFRPYLVPGSIWQDVEGPEGPLSQQESSLSARNNTPEMIDMLRTYYEKLFSLIVTEMPGKIYDSTPPYRVTQFELLTRLLQIYPNPRDFNIDLALRKYDNIYPQISFPNQQCEHRRGEIGYVFGQMDYLSSSNFFGQCGQSAGAGPGRTYDSMVLDTREEPLRSLIRGEKTLELKPLHPLLKRYIHSAFFRTPALAPRGLRLLIQGLTRIHFEQREEGTIDQDLLPNMKSRYYSRPFSNAIVREVYRKLACFNNDDLIVSLFGMIVLRMFELELSKSLLRHAVQMWVHQKAENYLLDSQKQMLGIFFDTLRENCPSAYAALDPASVKLITE